MNKKYYEQLGNIKVLPVIKIEDENKALDLAQSLINGGLNAAEITFRTECAAKSLEKISAKFPEMLTAAGTILNAEQAKIAHESGAKIIISPGFNEKTVNFCLKNKILIIPGVATASEIEIALEMGIDVVKLFPAEAIGGVNLIKALSAPYYKLKFVPTGGINEKNFMEYLRIKSVLAVGGSFMVKDEYINSGEFDKICELTKQVCEKLKIEL